MYAGILLVVLFGKMLHEGLDLKWPNGYEKVAILKIIHMFLFLLVFFTTIITIFTQLLNKYV